MSNTNTTYKWSILIFCNFIPTYRSRYVLQISTKSKKGMNIWYTNYAYSHSNRIPRVRPTLRADIFLRGYCNHRSSISDPNFRDRLSSVNLGRALGEPTHPKSIFLTTFHTTHNNHLDGSNPPNNATWKRIFKSSKFLQKHR